ncbi:MAG: STAS domain-containing protein [Phycisphaeraceae bacterium]
MDGHQIELEQMGQILTARIGSDRLHAGQMQELAAECMERVRYSSVNTVLVDLETVEYLDSASLGPLVEMLQDLEYVRGRVGLMHCQEAVLRLLKITRLDTRFELFDSEQEAIARR